MKPSLFDRSVVERIASPAESVLADLVEATMPPCFNRQDWPAGRWCQRGVRQDGKPVLRWFRSPFLKDCPSWKAPAGHEPFAVVAGYDCNGCRLKPERSTGSEAAPATPTTPTMKCTAALFLYEDEVSYPGYERQHVDVVANGFALRPVQSVTFPKVPEGKVMLFTHSVFFNEDGARVMETPRRQYPSHVDHTDTVLLAAKT